MALANLPVLRHDLNSAVFCTDEQSKMPATWFWPTVNTLRVCRYVVISSHLIIRLSLEFGWFGLLSHQSRILARDRWMDKVGNGWIMFADQFVLNPMPQGRWCCCLVVDGVQASFKGQAALFT